MSRANQNLRDLWVAVLYRAVLDAARFGEPAPNGAERAARRRAHDWIMSGGADFRRVCEMAGFDPRMVVKRARDADFISSVKDYLDRFAKEDYGRGKKL